eukprot:TRINITY_DN1155_c0_g1_i1.p1 TRINITY_DN1155_c0_g1~~TRINITY_DN1155_c0_g1_i1.p1  ORF type:complete len:156 (-),score=57.21 TRINITY_DN1155_c0_g1_i1:81-548(-)
MCVSLALSLVVMCLPFGGWVERSRDVWDYAVTMIVLFFSIFCIGEKRFPRNGNLYLCLLIGFIGLWILAFLLLRKLEGMDWKSALGRSTHTKSASILPPAQSQKEEEHEEKHDVDVDVDVDANANADVDTDIEHGEIDEPATHIDDVVMVEDAAS